MPVSQVLLLLPQSRRPLPPHQPPRSLLQVRGTRARGSGITSPHGEVSVRLYFCLFTVYLPATCLDE